MDNFTRAFCIRRSIFKNENIDWAFDINNGMHVAFIDRDGWSASIASRSTLSKQSGNVEVGREKYLNECRKNACSYSLNVWIDDLVHVHSARWDGGHVSNIILIRGKWETLYFGLPSPKSCKSPYYVPIGTTG